MSTRRQLLLTAVLEPGAAAEPKRGRRKAAGGTKAPSPGKAIRFGLAAVKGVGEGAGEVIRAARQAGRGAQRRRLGRTADGAGCALAGTLKVPQLRTPDSGMIFARSRGGNGHPLSAEEAESPQQEPSRDQQQDHGDHAPQHAPGARGGAGGLGHTLGHGAEPAAQGGQGSAATPASAPAMSLVSHSQGCNTNAW